MHARAFVLRPLARRRAGADDSRARARAAVPARRARPTGRADARSSPPASAFRHPDYAWISSKCRYLVVEGPIGAGKTSLARALAPRSTATTLLERPEDNPFLARFYGDMARYALPTQLFFLFQRVDQLRGVGQFDMFRTRDGRRLPARQGPAVRAAHPDRRRVPALREDLFAPEAADADARPRDLPAGAGRHADRARAAARRRLRAADLGAVPARLADAYSRYFYPYEAAPLLIVNSERLNFVDDAGAPRAADRAHRRDARPPRVLQPWPS